jgi:hypothetical protein
MWGVPTVEREEKMSIKELASTIGREGFIVENGMRFRVEVRDVKTAYGNIRFLVSPSLGDGEAWVSGERLFLIGEE